MNKKILFILHLPPPVHGAAKVGEYIKNSKFINDSLEIDYINLSTSSSIEHVGKGGLQKLFNLLLIQTKLVKALASNRYNLCYMTLTASGAGFYKDLLVVIILKIFRKRIIYHFHNKGVHAYSKKFCNHWLYKLAFNNTKAILLSQSLYKDVANYITNNHTFFCPNGIPDKLSWLPAKKMVGDNKNCKLVFLSNMITEKGVYVLLHACALLKQREVAFECHFIGAWSDITPETFSAFIEQHSLDKTVIAHGPKYDAEKETLLQAADIFVLPTYYHNECFPLVLLEAMSLGLPIVSTPEGGITDIIIDGDTGFIVPQKDHVALAEKLELLIADASLRLKLGNAGRIRFLENFTIDRFEQNFTQIIKAAAS